MEAPVFCSDIFPKLLFFSENVPPLIYYSHFSAIAISLMAAIFIFFRGKDRLLNQVFAFTLLSFLTWVSLDSIFWASNSAGSIMFLWSMTILVEPLVYIGGFYLIYLLTSQKDISFRVKLGAALAYLPVIVLTPTIYTLSAFNVSNCLGVEGFVGYYDYVLEFFFVFALIYVAVKRYRESKELIIRKRIRSISIGIFLFLFAFSWGNMISSFTDDWQISQAGLFAMPIFICFILYSIVFHKTFDIKLVLRKYSVYVASLGSVTVVVAGLKFLARKVGLTNDYLDIVILAGAVSLFLPLKNYFYRFANTYLFSSLYDAREVIASLSNRLRSTLDSQKIYQYISEALQGAFHAKSFAILLFDVKKGAYRVAWRENFGEKVSWITLGKKTCSLLLKHDKPLFLEDGDDTRGVDFAPLQALGIVAVNPLNLKDKCVGLIVMGPKESGDIYNEEDFGVLDVVGTQAAIAIENARLFEEAQEFNAVLQDKVHKATHTLRTQNAKLKQLDQMKTEFISIASHQLRTPLTASRWALDFLKKGRDGKLSKDQKETVEELSTVNQKLIRLVNDLLNVSRIDENRIRIDPKPTDVVAMLRETMKEYMPIAEHKRLKVIEQYDDIPRINLDENVIAKAISNFLSNAVKYDRDGRKLWITVEKQSKAALITIRDEGIGIPKSEQDHIFQKFYRASNAASSQTEGTGLGLYIAKSAIEKSGGDVRFESVEGKGTTFFVRLPFSGSRAVQGEKSLS